MSEDLTQEKVNDIAAKIKSEWDREVLESGKSEALFIVTDKTGFVAQFMLNYQSAKDHVESLGFVMPEIVKGLEVVER